MAIEVASGQYKFENQKNKHVGCLKAVGTPPKKKLIFPGLPENTAMRS
jgi:hypothetical protein